MARTGLPSRQHLREQTLLFYPKRGGQRLTQLPWVCMWKLLSFLTSVSMPSAVSVLSSRWHWTVHVCPLFEWFAEGNAPGLW